MELITAAQRFIVDVRWYKIYDLEITLFHKLTKLAENKNKISVKHFLLFFTHVL
jgi:hypothetical protein